MFAIYTKWLNVFKLEEDGFASREEVFEWAKEHIGMVDWRMLEYQDGEDYPPELPEDQE